MSTKAELVKKNEELNQANDSLQSKLWDAEREVKNLKKRNETLKEEIVLRMGDKRILRSLHAKIEDKVRALENSLTSINKTWGEKLKALQEELDSCRQSFAAQEQTIRDYSERNTVYAPE